MVFDALVDLTIQIYDFPGFTVISSPEASLTTNKEFGVSFVQVMSIAFPSLT